MEKNIQKVLISREQIQAKVQEMAAQLSAEYADSLFTYNPLTIINGKRL